MEIIILFFLFLISFIGGILFKNKKGNSPIYFLIRTIKNLSEIVINYPKLWLIDGKIYFLSLFRKKERAMIKEYEYREVSCLYDELKEYLVIEPEYKKSKFLFEQVYRNRKRRQMKKKGLKTNYHLGLSKIENKLRNYYYFEPIEKERWKRGYEIDYEIFKKYEQLEFEDIKRKKEEEELNSKRLLEKLKIEEEKRKLSEIYDIEKTNRKIVKSNREGDKFDQGVVIIKEEEN